LVSERILAATMICQLLQTVVEMKVYRPAADAQLGQFQVLSAMINMLVAWLQDCNDGTLSYLY